MRSKEQVSAGPENSRQKTRSFSGASCKREVAACIDHHQQILGIQSGTHPLSLLPPPPALPADGLFLLKLSIPFPTVCLALGGGTAETVQDSTTLSFRSIKQSGGLLAGISELAAAVSAVAGAYKSCCASGSCRNQSNLTSPSTSFTSTFGYIFSDSKE